jgi:hypothetical protein
MKTLWCINFKWANKRKWSAGQELYEWRLKNIVKFYVTAGRPQKCLKLPGLFRLKSQYFSTRAWNIDVLRRALTRFATRDISFILHTRLQRYNYGSLCLTTLLLVLENEDRYLYRTVLRINRIWAKNDFELDGRVPLSVVVEWYLHVTKFRLAVRLVRYSVQWLSFA